MQGRDSVSDLNAFHGYRYLFGSATRRTIEVIAKRNLKAVPVLLKLGADANEKGASVALQVLFGCCFFLVLKWSHFSKEIDDTRWNFRGHPNVKLKLVYQGLMQYLYSPMSNNLDIYFLLHFCCTPKTTSWFPTRCQNILKTLKVTVLGLLSLPRCFSCHPSLP